MYTEFILKSTNKIRFHENQKDVGMAVLNKVCKQVWQDSITASTLHCPT